MNNAKAFGNILARIRKEQGYASAHQFFKGIGGSKTLGLAFVSYWDLERGKKLPKSWRLKSVLSALGIGQQSPKARELVRAYFRALSGSDELVEMLAAPAAPGPELPDRELAEAALRQAQAKRTVNLTLEQWKVIAADLAADICHDLLVDTPDWVTVSEMAKETKFKPEAIKKAFKALASAGLVKLSGDKARSLLAGKVIKELPRLPETAAIKDAMNEHMRVWLAGAAKIGTKSMSVRMTKENLRAYLHHLEKAIHLASVYGDPEADRQGSAIYSINANIYRLTPRD